MYYLYYLQSTETSKYYIGITNNLHKRLLAHQFCARAGKNTPLYVSMRKYSFYMVEMGVYQTWIEAQEAEKQFIALARQQGKIILNIADGGEGGFVIPENKKDAWKAKLSKARVGRQPALGMKHTEETKKLCGEFGKLRWDTYGRYPKEVTTHSFKEASKLFGISKTHYYRLLKQHKSNDLV